MAAYTPLGPGSPMPSSTASPASACCQADGQTGSELLEPLVGHAGRSFLRQIYNAQIFLLSIFTGPVARISGPGEVRR